MEGFNKVYKIKCGGLKTKNKTCRVFATYFEKIRNPLYQARRNHRKSCDQMIGKIITTSQVTGHLEKKETNDVYPIFAKK